MCVASKEKPEGKGAHLVSNVKFSRSVEVEDCIEGSRMPANIFLVFSMNFIPMSIVTYQRRIHCRQGSSQSRLP